MSRSGILEALRSEERSLRSQLVAIQRAIEAIEGNAPPTAGRGRKKAAKAVRRPKPRDERRAAQSRRRADAQVLGIAPGGQGAGGSGKGVTRRAGLAGVWPLHSGFDQIDDASVRIRDAGRASEPGSDPAPGTELRAASLLPLTGTRPGTAPRIL